MIEILMSWAETIMLTGWIYPLIGILTFLDCLFPFLPSEIPLNMVGAWSGSQGYPHMPTMFAITVGAAVLGDNVCFFLGTKLMRFFNRTRKGSRTHELLLWVKRMLRQNGGAAIVIARFIPSARLVMTIMLGSMRYPWPLFFLFDALGVAIWVGQALAIGYLGGMAFSETPLVAMGVSVVAAIAIGWGVQRAQSRFLDWRDTRRGFSQTPLV